LKNARQAPWYLTDTNMTVEPQWIVCVSSLESYEAWLPWVVTVRFQEPSAKDLL